MSKCLAWISHDAARGIGDPAVEYPDGAIGTPTQAAAVGPGCDPSSLHPRNDPLEADAGRDLDVPRAGAFRSLQRRDDAEAVISGVS